MSSPHPTEEKSDPSALRHLDGSLLEGGGQVLRNCVAYSALLKRPIRITKIRAGRQPKPGLRPQHLKGIELIHTIVGGSLKNAKVNSDDITFQPGNAEYKHLLKDGVLHAEADTQTAGSITLLIQSCLPVITFLPVPAVITLKGGTNASHAPLIDYVEHIFLPMYNQLFHENVEFHLIRRGFMPAGGGVVEIVNKKPVTRLESITLMERGTVTRIFGLAFVSGKVPLHVATRMARAATNALKHSPYAHVPTDIKQVEQRDGHGEGVFILIVAETSTGCRYGASQIGEKRKSAENVAQDAVKELLDDLKWGGCTDQWLQDQLIIYAALAHGTSRILTGPLTLHTETALYWAQHLAGATIRVSPSPSSSKSKSTSTSTSTSTPTSTDEKSDQPDPITNETFIIEIDGIGYMSRWNESTTSSSTSTITSISSKSQNDKK